MSNPDLASGSVRRAELIATLSLGVDVGLGIEMEDSLRVCVASTRIAAALGFEGEELRLVYYLALVRLAGCTADAHQLAEVMGDELYFGSQASSLGTPSPQEMLRFLWGFMGKDRSLPAHAAAFAGVLPKLAGLSHATQTHCEVATMLCKRLGLRQDVGDAVWFFFERWDGKGRPKGRAGEEIPLPVRVVQVGQQAIALQAAFGRENLSETLGRQSGKALDPHLVDRVTRDLALIPDPGEGLSPWDEALASEPHPHLEVSGDEVDAAFDTLGEFADLKSLYTAGNAAAVSALAAAAGSLCGLDDHVIRTLRRASSVKDLGRVGVSAGIWDKEDSLTHAEWEKVRLHPYLGERIMARSDSFKEIGRLASFHHESLDGSGYHRSASAAEIGFPARILQAADRYQAMISRRPWRPALTPEKAAEQLEEAAERETLDPRAVAAVLEAAGQRSGRRKSHVGGLTEREVEVLQEVADGFTTKEIAARLHISKKTADHHIQNIYSKLDISTRAAATLYAMQNGLIRDTKMG
jgi:HD-GYP domain-containing protein (c-di-GMP phosphodiesterase class II)